LSYILSNKKQDLLPIDSHALENYVFEYPNYRDAKPGIGADLGKGVG